MYGRPQTDGGRWPVRVLWLGRGLGVGHGIKDAWIRAGARGCVFLPFPGESNDEPHALVPCRRNPLGVTHFTPFLGGRVGGFRGVGELRINFGEKLGEKRSSRARPAWLSSGAST